MSFAYSIREGLAGFSRARFAAFASTSAIVVALSLLGVFALVGYHADRVATWLQQEAGEFEVFLTDDSDALVPQIERNLLNRDEIATVEFISEQQAVEIFREEFGEGGDFFESEAFLPASFKVRVRPEYAVVDSLAQLIPELSSLEGVTDVVFNQNLLDAVQRNLRVFLLISGVIGVLVVLTVLFLVGNTIRLTIYARRLLIRTMKLVGATDRFIRRPFVIEGSVQGLIGGLIAGGVVWGAFRLLEPQIGHLFEEFWPGGSVLYTLAALVIVGVALGLLGSFFSAQRFIRTVSLH
ncbi:MAG: permease-like cell division protein FtsX [Bacteroidota bacterium]